MAIIIKKPDQKHAKAIATICTHGWKQTVEGKLSEEYQTSNINYWYNIERIKSDLNEGVYSYIALMNSKVVGVVGGGPTNVNTGEIYVLYVNEDVRYQGIGKKLLQILTDDQIREGIREQWVSVQEDNHRGIPFYEARGFIFKEKRITETKTGEQQVSLRYFRKLNPN